MSDDLGWPTFMLPGTRRKVLQRVREWYDKLPKKCKQSYNQNSILNLVMESYPDGQSMVELEDFAKLFAEPISKGKTDAESLIAHCKKTDLGGWDKSIEKGAGCFKHLDLL